MRDDHSNRKMKRISAVRELCDEKGETKLAAPEGIEPPSKVPETFVLSIKLRSRDHQNGFGMQMKEM